MAEQETIEELDRAERRRRWLTVGLIVLIVAGAAVYLVVPRSVASGEVDGHAWSLRIAPVAVGSSVQLIGPAAQDVESRSVPRAGGLDESVVWQLGRDPELGEEAAAVGMTLVVGPTPSGVDSVRVTSDVRAREARVVRVGWQRYHVAMLPGLVEVDELVAIDAAGRPLEVVDRGSSDADG